MTTNLLKSGEPGNNGYPKRFVSQNYFHIVLWDLVADLASCPVKTSAVLFVSEAVFLQCTTWRRVDSLTETLRLNKW